MSGAARESYRIWVNPRRFIQRRTWRYMDWRLALEDNFGPLVCWLVGHRPYNTALLNEPPEHACLRCHSWLPSLNPLLWRCEKHGVEYSLRDRESCHECQREWDDTYKQLTSVLGRVK